MGKGSCTGNEREVFTAFCKSRYGVTDGSGPGGCTRSKTITTGKGEMIVNVLKGDPASLHYSSKFRHWVKQRGFKLISHQALGLRDVLCLPAKKKVSYCKCFIAVRAPTLFLVEPK